MTGEKTEESPSKSWMASLNLWIVVPTLICIACLLFFGLKLQSKLTVVQLEAVELATTKVKLEEMVVLKDQLLGSLHGRQQREGNSINALRSGFEFIACPADIPIKEGEFVFFSERKRTDGTDFFYYVPSGKHELTIRIAIGNQNQNMTSYQGIHSKMFALPEDSCGQLVIRFQNEGKDCNVVAKLIDANDNEIDRHSFKVPKRTARGKMTSHSAGNCFYLPGDAFATQHGIYRNDRWHLQKTENGMLTLSTTVSLESEAEERFVGLEDVMQFLGTFDTMFEPEIKHNRLILTPAGIEQIRISQSDMF